MTHPESVPHPSLLVVSGVPPWPLKGGFSLRAAHLLEHLASRWTITLIVKGEPEPDTGGLDPAHGHRVIGVGVSRNWGSQPTLRSEVATLREAVDRVLHEQRPQAALLFPGTEFLAFGPNAFPPSVADRVDCGTLERFRYIRYARFLRRFGAAFEAIREARYERRLVRAAGATTVVGADDQRTLRFLSGSDTIHVVRNGVEVPHPAPDFSTEHRRPTVVFTGTLSYYANVDAAVHFARRIWPRIRRNVNDARFVIAGRTPSRRVRALSGIHGVEIQADVGDMNHILDEAWVAVAPLRCGAGVKNKILEAWAVGRPAVMTPIAANGLCLNAWTNDLVVRNDAAFSAAVISLLEDAELRHRTGEDAHTLVRSHHSWAQSAIAISNLLDSVSRGERPNQTGHQS